MVLCGKGEMDKEDSGEGEYNACQEDLNRQRAGEWRLFFEDRVMFKPIKNGFSVFTSSIRLSRRHYPSELSSAKQACIIERTYMSFTMYLPSIGGIVRLLIDRRRTSDERQQRHGGRWGGRFRGWWPATVFTVTAKTSGNAVLSAITDHCLHNRSRHLGMLNICILLLLLRWSYQYSSMSWDRNNITHRYILLFRSLYRAQFRSLKLCSHQSPESRIRTCNLCHNQLL